MKFILPLCFLQIAPLLAQKPLSSGSATTKGVCSPAVTGSGNTIKIKACGMTTEQVQEWRSSFKQILDKRIDPKVLIALLDDIKSGQIRIENGVLRIEEQVSKIGRGASALVPSTDTNS